MKKRILAILLSGLLLMNITSCEIDESILNSNFEPKKGIETDSTPNSTKDIGIGFTSEPTKDIETGSASKPTINIEITKQESKGLAFVSNGDGTCYISGIGSCTDKNIFLPTVAPNGDTVTSIGNHAFYASNTLESIIVPNTITQIGAYSFSNCTGLSNVTLSDSVVVLERAAFSGCENLETVTLSQNIVNIEDYTFAGCEKLKSITLYNSIHSIGYQAFAHCADLESLIIPNSVNIIEGYAFLDCEKIASITIPANVIEIQGGIFAGCKNLTNISVDSQNPTYIDTNNCIILKEKNELVAVCNRFTIPSNADITSIGKDAISQVNAVNIMIPKSITNFKFMAITGCSELKTISYEGTKEDWELITKDPHWFMINMTGCTIHCIDGIISTAS